MLRILVVALLLVLLPHPVPAADFRPNEPLGELLSKTKSLSMPNNAGGKNILENSCLNKKDFSMTASEEFLEHCDHPRHDPVRDQIRSPPPPARRPAARPSWNTSCASRKTTITCAIFSRCSEGKTERFAIVELRGQNATRLHARRPPPLAIRHGGPGGPGGRRP